MMKQYKSVLALLLVLFLGYGGYEFVVQPQSGFIEESVSSNAHFRNEHLLEEHYEKHGKAMGYTNAEEYEKGAQAVISNSDALTKSEQEDGDQVYYLESSNEIVFVSEDGIIRTYFNPEDGIDYYNRQ